MNQISTDIEVHLGLLETVADIRRSAVDVQLHAELHVREYLAACQLLLESPTPTDPVSRGKIERSLERSRRAKVEMTQAQQAAIAAAQVVSAFEKNEPTLLWRDAKSASGQALCLLLAKGDWRGLARAAIADGDESTSTPADRGLAEGWEELGVGMRRVFTELARHLSSVDPTLKAHHIEPEQADMWDDHMPSVIAEMLASKGDQT